MVRENRIKEYIFSIGSLTADANGRFDVFTDHTINGTIQSVSFLDANYTATGSLLLFQSGLLNSGTNGNDLVLKLRAGSENSVFYPVAYGELNTNTTGSPQAFTQMVVHAPLRLVGSGLGNGTSGLGYIVRYI